MTPREMQLTLALARLVEAFSGGPTVRSYTGEEGDALLLARKLLDTDRGIVEALLAEWDRRHGEAYCDPPGGKDCEINKADAEGRAIAGPCCHMHFPTVYAVWSRILRDFTGESA